jgi:hypothetical protein
LLLQAWSALQVPYLSEAARVEITLLALTLLIRAERIMEGRELAEMYDWVAKEWN